MGQHLIRVLIEPNQAYSWAATLDIEEKKKQESQVVVGQTEVEMLLTS